MPSLPSLTRNANESAYWVVHPLDDLPEQKRDVSAVGPMPMTPAVRLWLLALRGYLLFDDGLSRLPLSRPCSRAEASGELSAAVVSKPCPPL
jgi:hypothetical protein